MQPLTILNTREVKRIRDIGIEQFAYFPEEDYAYLLSEKNRIFVVNKDLSRIDLKKVRADKVGLYFAELKDNTIRLSKEGAQLLFNDAKKKKKELKNVVEMNAEEIKKYFSGVDLEKDLGAENRFILLKYKVDIIGCAKYKERKIINFLPKIHRGEVIV
ncbi:MAG: hypothetical protein AB1668_01635 [Nanoarchaeota archaeon]